MAPYFETVKSFADVPISDAGIDTAQFLEASDGLVTMFDVLSKDLLGMGVFSFVQLDIKNNIQGLRTVYSEKPEQCSTLEQLVHAQKSDREGHHDGIGCLRRLIRGLLFTCRSLQNSRANEHEAPQTSFRRAYDAVLKHQHNFAVRTVVYVALKTCPNRGDFYARIAQGGSQSKFDQELDRWLEGLDTIVCRMVTFYDQSGHGRV